MVYVVCAIVSTNASVEFIWKMTTNVKAKITQSLDFFRVFNTFSLPSFAKDYMSFKTCSIFKRLQREGRTQSKIHNIIQFNFSNKSPLTLVPILTNKAFIFKSQQHLFTNNKIRSNWHIQKLQPKSCQTIQTEFQGCHQLVHITFFEYHLSP